MTFAQEGQNALAKYHSALDPQLSALTFTVTVCVHSHKHLCSNTHAHMCTSKSGRF